MTRSLACRPRRMTTRNPPRLYTTLPRVDSGFPKAEAPHRPFLSRSWRRLSRVEVRRTRSCTTHCSAEVPGDTDTTTHDPHGRGRSWLMSLFHVHSDELP